MNNELRLKRLKKFAKILRTVPRKKFNLDTWGRKKALRKSSEEKPPRNFVEIDCRTAACALGWAALDKGFIKDGLHLKWDGEGNADVYYKQKIDEEAGAKFFGLTLEEAGGLFMLHGSYPNYDDKIFNYPVKKWKDVTPTMVALKVEILIEKYSKN